MITQTLLDAQRAAMTKDGMGLNCLSAERAATGSGGDNAMEHHRTAVFFQENRGVFLAKKNWSSFV